MRSSMWPSGFARATASVPMMPPAPPWLSTTTDLPRRSESWKAIMRPTTSLLPPGGKGMTRRSGLVGKVWALAAVAKARANAQRIFRVISSLRLDSGGLDEPSVLFDAAFQHRRKLLGRVGDDGHRELVDLSPHLGVPERRDQLVVQPRGRRGRQRRRAEQPEPGRGLLEARQRLADGGTSGSPGYRFASSTASTLSLPERRCGSTEASELKPIATSPAITPCSAGEAPLYGTWTMSTPAPSLNSSPDMWNTAPTPGLE